MAAQATRMVEPTPPVARAGETCGTVKAAIRPITDKTANMRGDPTLVTGGLQEKASGCRARQDGGKGPDFQQAVTGSEALRGDQLRENAVFRRGEERAVYAHPAQDDQRQHATGGVQPKCHCPRAHEEYLNDFDRDDDRAFAQTISQGAADQRQQDQR